MTKPSASLAVSTLALIVALGGTAGAAGGWINGNRIKPHTITSLQLATGAVKAPNVAPHAIRKSALADGVIVNNTVIAPAGPKGDSGASGPQGNDAPITPGPPGPVGSAVAWGYVGADGTLDAPRSHGIASVDHTSGGNYCVHLSVSASVVVVNPTANAASIAKAYDPASCPGGGWMVRTMDFVSGDFAFVDLPFAILAA